MGALWLGLLAALAWGIHDVCVRYVSQRTGIAVAILCVLLSGTGLILPFALAAGGWAMLAPSALGLSLVSGLSFAAASYGLYRAMALGPVRLVAPVVGAYPVLSVGWAALSGTTVPFDQWLAVLTVTAGVAVVAVTSRGDSEGVGAGGAAAIGWAGLSAAGFALTFGFGQAAAAESAAMPVLVLARLAAVAVIGSGFLVFTTRWEVPARPVLILLVVMGGLDALALGVVLAAGEMAHAEFAAVAASVFGVVTVLIAWGILREPMTPSQWGGVFMVFAAIGYLATR